MCDLRGPHFRLRRNMAPNTGHRRVLRLQISTNSVPSCEEEIELFNPVENWWA
jgi:hypothetical protein